MRLLLRLVLLLPFLLLAGAAPADDAQRSELNRLFAELANAPNAAAAQEIDDRIWEIWITPTDSAAAAAMTDLLQAQSAGDMAQALHLADRLTESHPDYAEGWNQRATIRYLIGDLDGSLADIKKVLEREPRHFGALAGRVLIHLDQGRRSLALLEMVQALKVHPFLAEKSLFPELGAGGRQI